ncbi:hypothetical protein GCM10028778_22600 [Barrientosiimonas marina]|uniref:Arm DNA-binding domain-containing protein n=1 Tax=Lentibacillus kimchii TaxID=1542911 RepID=A0ABW2UZU3_9BACI
MRGHIAKKGQKYYVVIDLGQDHKNKRKQKWFSGYERKKDAEKDLPKIINKLEQGYTDPANMTMLEYFEQWLQKKKNAVSEGTYEHYESYYMRKHIIPVGPLEDKQIKKSPYRIIYGRSFRKRIITTQ